MGGAASAGESKHFPEATQGQSPVGWHRHPTQDASLRHAATFT